MNKFFTKLICRY